MAFNSWIMLVCVDPALGPADQAAAAAASWAETGRRGGHTRRWVKTPYVTSEHIAFYDHSWNKFLSYTNIQQISSISYIYDCLYV